MKIAIITGASSGLGRAFAQRLAGYGLDELWVVARREDRLLALAEALPCKVRVLALDLMERESIERIRALLKEEQPDVRYLINAAGFGKFSTYADLTLQETNDMIGLNCRAVVDLTAVAIPYMGKKSHILEICSSSAFQPLPGLNLYAATKAFLLHYSRALRWEVAGRGICVTAVCPGWIKTEFMAVAQDTKNGRTVRSYPFAISPDLAARWALFDSRLGLAVSSVGPLTLLQRIAAKLLPHCVVMGVWELARRV